MNSKDRKILLLVLALASIISIFLIKFILSEIPESFDYGNVVGEVVYDLSLAYLAAYLFYQIVVVSAKREDIKNIYSSAKWLSFDITIQGSRIIKPRDRIYPPDVKDTIVLKLTKNDFHVFCKNHKLTDTYTAFWTNEVYESVSYAKHFISTQKKINEKIDETLRFQSRLETDHIRLLNEIKNCPFMTFGKHHLDDLEMSKNKPNLEFLEFVLFDFYQKIINLHNYMIKLKV